MTATVPLERPTGLRVVGFDAFRGLAVLAMFVDHLALVFGGPDELRLTIGRLAMPAFFLLAGHLAGRLRFRHLEIFALGILLPVFVPWVDAPNVLVWWAIGCAVLVAARAAGFPSWLLAAAALGASANGFSTVPDGLLMYDPIALYGLMALGQLIPSSSFTWAARAPRWVAVLGAHPIAFYVGHLVLLRVVQLQL